MSKIAAHFSNFRKTTPRYVQWILLGVALVLVVVLFVLLNTNKSEPKIIVEDAGILDTPELVIEPDDTIDWSDVTVGDTRQTPVTVRATKEVQIKSIFVEQNSAAGLSVDDGNCANAIVSETRSCVVSVEYNPTTASQQTSVGITISWNALDSNAEQETPNAITVVIGAHEKPKPKIIEPVVEPEPVYYDAPEPMSVASGFQDELDDIAPNFSWQDEPKPSDKPRRSAFGTACSDFAFPGYNTAGVQSGWIKPVGGAYYYYPFSDIDCTGAPAGIYNADSGFIMDANNPSKKIGSDAEHIRYVMENRFPNLGLGPAKRTPIKAKQLSSADLENLHNNAYSDVSASYKADSKSYRVNLTPRSRANVFQGYNDEETVYSSSPYDRTFVLRQYKPIPATIVSDIQADPKLLETGIPVRATVDRNVYSDNGRTIIIPTGTLMLGRVVGGLPGPYKAVGRMEIQWYQFIRPDGVEFSFQSGQRPFSADSQGRKGVPGHGSTDYLQQFVMPMLTAIVPAAVNLIAPISDAFVNQIDLDNNTVVQSGTVRSSELAKNEIITAWNNVATKLLVDMMDNTTPPFSIAAGTRITVFSPVDLLVTCGDPTEDNRKCAIHAPSPPSRGSDPKPTEKDYANSQSQTIEEAIGQVRSMMESSLRDNCCKKTDDGISWVADYTKYTANNICKNYSFTTLDFYCRSFGTYDAINNEKQRVLFANQQATFAQNNVDEQGNLKSLNLKYNEDGTIQNPFQKQSSQSAAAPQETITDLCGNGGTPDANGCCPGETLTDMGDQGFNCCPDAGGDCFPPIEM